VIALKTYIFYVLAAFAEIGGCFAFWVWLRQGKNIVVLVPGVLSLMAFALLLTKIDTERAGRAYAAYGGVYILASLVWLWLVEGQRPDAWDLSGVSLCLVGGGLILFGPR
jgi:small multidrug resistance family-3 protein